MSSAARFFLLVLLGLSLQACSLSGGPFDGALREEGTNSPISGAIVVVRWQHHQGYSGTVCYHVESAVTDETGRFHIPQWSNPSDHRALKDPRTSFDFFAAGFTPARKTENTLYGRKLSKEREQRLEELGRLLVATRCGDGGSSEKNRMPLLKALLAEARALRGSDYDKAIEPFIFELEILELGYEAAEARHVHRLEDAANRRPSQTLAIGATDPRPGAFVGRSQQEKSEPPRKQD